MSNIIFREINYKDDIDEIIALLNKSFNSDHNKEKFIWKHFENPFGKSYGLLAIDNNLIIGLRMFMRWEFKKGDKIIKAIRPVDTCTHPEYQGRGIFKKLTLTGLDNIKNEYELIFNTPNENSRPGYLKMGWNEIENLNQYKSGVVNFFNKPLDFEMILSEDLDYLNDRNDYSTNLSKEFFKWRYSDESYKIAKFVDGGVLIYKFLKSKGIKTLILVDIFGEPNNFSKYITSISVKNKLVMIYYLHSIKNSNLGNLITFNRGKQVIVYKDDNLNIFNKLNFSLGDLEGKL